MGSIEDVYLGKWAVKNNGGSLAFIPHSVRLKSAPQANALFGRDNKDALSAFVDLIYGAISPRGLPFRRQSFYAFPSSAAQNRANEYHVQSVVSTQALALAGHVHQQLP